MDDSLEIPRAQKIQEGDDNSSGDEDGGLDWTRLPKFDAAARPIIPKRGEKDFEPASGGGSGLQLHVLDRSREAMFEALRADRSISSKTISYGIWYPFIDRVHVTTARGIHFSTMGHSVSRSAQFEGADDKMADSSSKLPKRLELLPEEALYLIERGALFCYKSISASPSLADIPNPETQSPGAPMSVQQAFAEMIGRDEVTLERYQVYAYLKRLGFVLMRAKPPTPEYPTAPPIPLATHPWSITRALAGLFTSISSMIMKVFRVFSRSNWWRRLQPHRHKTNLDIFKALRFIPCGHSAPLHNVSSESKLKHSESPSPSASSQYKIFYHAYKPSTPFRKTVPPAPDFYIVVVDARTTSMPSLQELTELFHVLPEMPLPPPRKRGVQPPGRQTSASLPPDIRPTPPESMPASPTKGSLPLTQPTPAWYSRIWAFLRRLFFFLPFSRADEPAQTSKSTFTPPKPNPFLALKTGKKTVVIAAVDSGSISFFRFGEGAFEEWPMV